MRNMLFGLIAVLGLSVPLMAEEAGSEHNLHMKHESGGKESMPVESGQSAFAAIQEIVGKLEADPKTDWSKVNIESLRQHLIDMENVTLRSIVSTNIIEGGAQFMVSSPDPAVRSSIRRMLSAHSNSVVSTQQMHLAVAKIPDGVSLTATGEEAKIRGIGFLGILSLGMHHQTHH